MRPHIAVRRIGIILRSIFPKVLSRLEDNDFPAGKRIDHIVQAPSWLSCTMGTKSAEKNPKTGAEQITIN
jgi:hypothetical protein